MSAQIQQWLQLAIDVAEDAGRKLLEYSSRELRIKIKTSPQDFVTEADLASEALILQRLREHCPDHGILSEEAGEVVGGGGLQWIVDPLDGTTNFAHGFPHYSVVVALYDGGAGLVGVVHEPSRNETFFATRSGGAFVRSSDRVERLRVTSISTLHEALLATGFGYDRLAAQQHTLPAVQRLVARGHGIRRAGSAALDLAYVAAGRLDGYWERDLAPWDWAAGALLVREAGGEVLSAANQAWSMGDATLAAAGPSLIDEFCREVL